MMHSTNRFGIAFLMAGLLATGGCDLMNLPGGSGGEGTLEIRTGQDEYQFGDSPMVHFDNNLGQSVFKASCSGHLYRQAEDGWEQASYVECENITVTYQRLPQDGHLADSSLGIFSSRLEAGRYRFRFGLYDTEKGRELLPREQRVSNTFVIDEG